LIVAIHQPNYLPWYGYFQKIAEADRFVFLDDAEYSRNSFINRNRVKTPAGLSWLTVPVARKGRSRAAINEIPVDPNDAWIATHRKTLQANYARAPFFDDVLEAVLEPVLMTAGPHWESLAALNAALIGRVCEYLAITTPRTFASEHGVRVTGTQRLIALVRAVGGTTYLSGRGGGKYQDEAAFAAAGIDVRTIAYLPITYEQLWGPFERDVSIIDMLFHCGRDAGATLHAAERVAVSA
jgi:hypothetical protein